MTPSWFIPYRHEHLAYDDAGHGLALPNLPTTAINSGTIADAWAKVLEFLKLDSRL